MCDRQGVNVFGRVCDAGGVLIGVEDTMDGEPGRRCGVADQVDDHPVALQWLCAPVHGDLGEQPVFDFVPFAGARGQVADGDPQPGLGGERGQLDLPGADPVAVGAAAVGADQQPIGMRVAAPPDGIPPAAQSRHGERGGVVVGAHRHPAGVGETS